MGWWKGCDVKYGKDCDTDKYKQPRYAEVAKESKIMLVKHGWNKDFVKKGTPVMPSYGWMGDNLLKKSDNMGWRKDCVDKYEKAPSTWTPSS
eukprot:2629972-Pyramimonas_sp.AAC.1